jgi:RNA polymerase sigma-70 factor (ECF subfamily)
MSDTDARIDVTAELPALRRYGLALTRDPADAEELVHETLVRALEKRGSFRHGRPLRPWLLSILHNIFIDGTRRRRTEHEALADAAILSPGHQTAPQDQRVRLNQLLDRFMALPEEQRAAMHLVSIEGLSYAEAASALAIPVGTLMSRLGRARAALRELENAAEAGANAPGGKTLAAPQLKIVGGRDD